VSDEAVAAKRQENRQENRQEIGPWPQAVGSALLSAAGFIAFVLIFIETGNFSAEAQPFPRLIAIVGALGAGISLAQSCRSALAVRRAERVMSRTDSGPSWRDLAISYAGPPIYGAMLIVLGFWLASVIFLVGLLAVLGERRPLVIAAIAGGTLGAIYLVFEVGFSIHLPGSMLLPLFGS
jgi:hypothetical protein